MRAPFINNDINLFMTQILSLKAETTDWMQFLDKWKMRRILYEDKFPGIWGAMKEDLGIPSDPIYDRTEDLEHVIDDEDAKMELEETTTTVDNDKEEND